MCLKGEDSSVGLRCFQYHCYSPASLGFCDLWDSIVSPFLNQLHHIMLSKLIYLWNPARNSEFMALTPMFPVKPVVGVSWPSDRVDSSEVRSWLPQTAFGLLQAPIPWPAEQCDTNQWSEARDKSQLNLPSCVFPLLCFSFECFPELTKWLFFVTPLIDQLIPPIDCCVVFLFL